MSEEEIENIELFLDDFGNIVTALYENYSQSYARKMEVSLKTIKNIIEREHYNE